MCGGVCVAASGPVERVYLSAPIVAIRGKEVNLTAVVWPSHTRTLTFFWWFDNSSEVRSFSSYSHYCSTHTLFSLSCLLQSSPSSLDVLVLLFTKCDSTELSHKSCKMWLHVTGAVSSWRIPARMAGHIYLSHWLFSLQHPLIIQYVKGCMYVVFYIRLRGSRVFPLKFSVFFLLKPSPL